MSFGQKKRMSRNNTNTMKHIPAIILFLLSCSGGPDVAPTPQNILNKQLLALRVNLSKAPNDIIEKEMRDSALNYVNGYFADTLGGVLKQFVVSPKDISVSDFRGIKAFYAEFEDYDGHKYWMEFDFDLKDTAILYSSSLYKFLKNVPEYRDTVMNFLYLNKIEWQSSSYSKLKVHAVPFPIDGNKDSVIQDIKRMLKYK